MPKAAASKPAAHKEQAALLILSNGTKRVLIPRPKSYKAAVDAARRHFPAIKAEDIVFQTKDLAICDGELLDIAPESWELVIDSIKAISVVERHECPQGSSPVIPSGKGLPPPLLAPSSDKLIINFYSCDTVGKIPSVTVKPTTPFRKIYKFVAEKAGLDRDDFYLVFDGARFHEGQTPEDLNMCNGDYIDVGRTQRGGKPVIYLYSPTEIDAAVALTLTREWSFSAIYPVVPTKILPSSGRQRIQWNIRTHMDGNLTETTTALDVAYLFWEAHTNHGIPASPPASPVAQQFSPGELFSPLTSDLCPADSVVIPVAEITPYLDKVLLVLGLHTEARTSFITYWLPSFLKHKHIALRFVPQAAYEAAAALDISPAPDVVTRVFMLFKGIADDDAVGAWAGARAADDDGERWRRVVGLDAERAADASLFRVLEWGGMEVLGR
ncbi:hypothetical protein B0H16DRAFT_1368503 [Mycena metata]|uniref:Ubiquitin-like domain-containing protein n=1 Tax=Mycena metata TaxID=1033252 RepID=A0AAD7JE16_9AGAR|nr:hypothetical protein B0H16DRAFT_1368503 [Mycena metata]